MTTNAFDPPVSIMSWYTQHPCYFPYTSGDNCCGTVPSVFDRHVRQALHQGEEAFNKALAMYAPSGSVDAGAFDKILSSLPGTTIETLNSTDCNDGTVRIDMYDGTPAGPGTPKEFVGCGNHKAMEANLAAVRTGPVPPTPANAANRTIGRYSAAYTILESFKLNKLGLLKIHAKKTSTSSGASQSQMHEPIEGTPSPYATSSSTSSSSSSSSSSSAPTLDVRVSASSLSIGGSAWGSELADPSLTLSVDDVRQIFANIRSNAKNHLESAMFIDTDYQRTCCGRSEADKWHVYERYINSGFERGGTQGDSIVAWCTCLCPCTAPVVLLSTLCHLTFCYDCLGCDSCHKCVAWSNPICYHRSLHHASYRILNHAWDLAVREEAIKSYNLLCERSNDRIVIAAPRVISTVGEREKKPVITTWMPKSAAHDWAWDIIPVYSSAHPFTAAMRLKRKQYLPNMGQGDGSSGVSPAPQSGSYNEQKQGYNQYIPPQPSSMGTTADVIGRSQASSYNEYWHPAPGGPGGPLSGTEMGISKASYNSLPTRQHVYIPMDEGIPGAPGGPGDH